MFSTILSIFSEEASAAASASFDNSTGIAHHEVGTLSSSSVTPTPFLDQSKTKKRRNLPGNPDPDAEVIALSPKTLLATNRFVCEICSKGFQRDQNLQLHRRGHNLPWKLKQRNSKDAARKRVYVCPEPTCVHHDPSRALGDLTGIKKHFCRKHGEKKWKCEKCAKIYAVQSDWKAHSKTCGTREYRCDCGTLFSRKDSFVTHRAFCDALAEESARLYATNSSFITFHGDDHHRYHPSANASDFNLATPSQTETTASLYTVFPHQQNPSPEISLGNTHPFFNSGNHLNNVYTKPEPYFRYTQLPSSAMLSATALLQKAATVGASVGSSLGQTMMGTHVSTTFDDVGLSSTWQKSDSLTRDFLGLTGDDEQQHVVQCSRNNAAGRDDELLTYTATEGGFPGRSDRSIFKAQGFGSWRHC